MRGENIPAGPRATGHRGVPWLGGEYRNFNEAYGVILSEQQYILLLMFCKTAYDCIDLMYGFGSDISRVGLVFILGAGVILLGVGLMLIMNWRHPEFFKGQVISRASQLYNP